MESTGGAHRSAVVAVRSEDPQTRGQAMGVLVRAFWKPTYKYFRLKWKASEEEAMGLTERFFTEAHGRKWFDAHDSEQERFRTFLLSFLDRFAHAYRRSGRRMTPGGELANFGLDFAQAEQELRDHPIPVGVTAEQVFDREWVRYVLEQAIDTLKSRCEARGHKARFEIFQRCGLQQNSADAADPRRIARELGLSTRQVATHLDAARRDFRDLVQQGLRALTGSEAEFRSEAKAVLKS